MKKAALSRTYQALLHKFLFWSHPNHIHVLFICLANICRSPMAEALLREKVKSAHLSQFITVDSASIENWRNGAHPDIRVEHLLKSKGISTQRMTSRLLLKEDGQRFDYILCMDQNIYQATLERLGEENLSHVYPFSQFLPDHQDILDPTVTKDFQTTYSLIDQGTTILLDHLKDELKRNNTHT